MTTPERRVLSSALATAGLLLSSGMTLAADFDVSSIYGRGAPPNAHITATSTPAATETRSAMATDGATTIHEQNLDGTPLVEGRGMREGVDRYATAPVRSAGAFDVSDILGRSSPPAPANAPNFGHPG